VAKPEKAETVDFSNLGIKLLFVVDVLLLLGLQQFSLEESDAFASFYNSALYCVDRFLIRGGGPHPLSGELTRNLHPNLTQLQIIDMRLLLP